MDTKKPCALTRAFRWFMYYLVLIPVMALVNFLWFGLKIDRTAPLPKGQGCIFICNHVHFLDSTMTLLAAWPKKLYYATLNSNFRLPVAGWLLKQFDCFPVGENLTGTREFVRYSKDLLAEGKSIAIFPEGELELYSKHLRNFRRGAFSLAVSAGAPIVPMVLTQRPPKGLWKLFRKKPLFTLHILAPLYPKKDLPERENCSYLKDKAFRRMESAQRHSFLRERAEN